MSMGFKVLGVGEVLWDLLPGGPQLGGAPANFACHAAALGAKAGLVSCVGRDELGREALRLLGARGLDLSAVSIDATFPTGTVAVVMDSAGHPVFTIAGNTAWDAVKAGERAVELAAGSDAICFGSLSQRTAASGMEIRRLVQATRSKALRVFDVNLRPPFYTPDVITASLELANVLKLNETELPVLSGLYQLRGSPEMQLETLAGRFGLDVVALTLGAAGSRLFRDGRWTAEPARPVVVKDAVGAGDSFTAALVAGLLRQWPTPKLLAAASEVSAFVCTCAGATPELPQHLVRMFRPADVPVMISAV